MTVFDLRETHLIISANVAVFDLGDASHDFCGFFVETRDNCCDTRESPKNHITVCGSKLTKLSTLELRQIAKKGFQQIYLFIIHNFLDVEVIDRIKFNPPET